ncbi:unnamed protein product [Peronospora destructor]|uniref:Uncharacterized protein n=1 Tax=Peronospora destructor TaxID=86335 RepID=A0AAV0TYC5_9STRA|nr:unnamed protein product [Peronospora destructor]
MVENRSDRSNSTLAEDDGTLYGKEFNDNSTSTDEVVTPVLDDAAMRANQKIVVDSMNQKFLPMELRKERSSIFAIAHIDVIKKSKLNLSEAEERIRHRGPHLVFELLSKASEIYPWWCHIESGTRLPALYDFVQDPGHQDVDGHDHEYESAKSRPRVAPAHQSERQVEERSS